MRYHQIVVKGGKISNNLHVSAMILQTKVFRAMAMLLFYIFLKK